MIPGPALQPLTKLGTPSNLLADIQVEKLGEGQFKKLFEGQSSVRFHTRNYSRKIHPYI